MNKKLVFAGLLLIFVGMYVITNGGVFSPMALVSPQQIESGALTLGAWRWKEQQNMMWRSKIAQKVLLPSNNEQVQKIGVAIVNFGENPLTYKVGLATSLVAEPFLVRTLPVRRVSSWAEAMSGYSEVDLQSNYTVAQNYVYVVVWCEPVPPALEGSAYVFFAGGNLTGYTDERGWEINSWSGLVQNSPFAVTLTLADKKIEPPITTNPSPTPSSLPTPTFASPTSSPFPTNLQVPLISEKQMFAGGFLLAVGFVLMGIGVLKRR